MDPERTISLTEGRKRIFQIVDEVQEPAIYYTLTEKGRPKVVIMSAEEFDSWQETLEVMHDLPHLKEDIARAKQDYIKGKTIDFDDFLARDKRHVSNSSRPKSRKKPR